MLSLLLISFSLFPLSTEIQTIVNTAAEKELAQALEYLENQIAAVQKVQDKRELIIVTASLQESSGFYELASKNYEKAAGMQAAEGSETSASLLLKAVRCSLSYGDFQRADSYLTTVSRTSVSAELSAKIKLYAVWSWLSKVSDEESLHEPIVILSSYVGLKTMESVQSSVLLTLWYLTGDASYSTKLIQNYPQSMESSIVQGKINLLPSPFWYFVPRKTAALSQTTIEAGSLLTDTDKTPNTAPKADVSKENTSSSTRIVHYQLGFYRNRENAQDLSARLIKAGFKPDILEELRQSGTLYYAVIVKENSAQNMGAQLKNAGFECYPVFE